MALHLMGGQVNPSVEDRARRIVRDAVSASVALVTREVEGVNEVAPAVLIEGADVQVVAQVLAAMVGTLLSVTLPDGGRTLLVRIGLQAASEPAGSDEADR